MESAKSHHKIVRAMLYTMPWPGVYEPSRCYYRSLFRLHVASQPPGVPFSTVHAIINPRRACAARVIIQYSRSACLGLRLWPASCLSVVVCLVSVVTPAYRKSIEARTNLFLFIFNYNFFIFMKHFA